MKAFQLRNGVYIPAVGMGTGWMNTAYKRPTYFAKRIAGEVGQRLIGKYSKESNYTVSYELRKLRLFEQSIAHSRNIGYSLYDTAYSYNNCKKMGKALSFPHGREDVFIISKCSNSAQRDGLVREEFENTLADLGTDYVDLYLVHWPQTGTYLDTWKILEELYYSGGAKAIGVSNFNIHHIDDVLSNCSVAPMVNEVECHPLLQQNELRDYCKQNGIILVAHTATGKMRGCATWSLLADIADHYERSIAQVVLRWHFQLGDVSICNTLNKSHMQENLDIFDYELTDQEMEQIGTMDSGVRIWPDPDRCDFTKL